MNELIWDRQWTRAQIYIHDAVTRFNTQLAQRNSNTIIVASLIDAVNLENINALSLQHDYVHVISEHNVTNSWNNVVVHQLPDSFYGAYHIAAAPATQDIERDFNCFVNRNDPIRQSWFYFLYKKKWLDKGFVSFNMRSSRALRSLDQLDDHESLTAGLEDFETNHKNYLRSFDEIYDQVKKIVPYKNFTENLDLCDLISRSKFSLIIETYFDRPDCGILTEKTWRAVQMPRPWILFAATGCVQKLRDLGFDVFDEFVDHSYDKFETSQCAVERQDAILIEMEKLISLKVTDPMIARWQQITVNNQQIMRDWSVRWKNDCDAVLRSCGEMADAL